MTKRVFTLAFNKEVIRFVEEGHSFYEAVQYFEQLDNVHYDRSMFRQWYLNRANIDSCSIVTKKRVKGAGRKPLLGNLEEIIYNQVIEMRIQKIKVKR